MKYIRNSEDRGVANHGWLDSKHSFSFANYYDPKHMGVSVLRVINDDTVAPGEGFGAHSHRDMEIISYVTQGSLKHKDSEGNEHIVSVGEIQRMSAGTGVVHSEYNASNTEDVKFFQIWIEPNKMGIKPRYEQKNIPQKGALTPLITANGKDGSISIQQEASLSRLVLQEKEIFKLDSGKHLGYLHIIKGELTVDGEKFAAGDAFSVEPSETLKIEAISTLEAMWFELPTQH
ncbi:pirin family protein [Moritella sp. Urea-trap-13]|uniref:pirin family protein n=1 Tax=Moritella sp. Urea-trap-13 TaxID=2058327 RepID=UPI000C31BFF5|nr:pirin family protein [Moritella sp. Urea-trap-13]PKH06633.1 pirin family protein [Moritella sp. Urea-trap-13]